MRILHLITGLDVGGTELFLARLCTALSSRGTRNDVISIRPPGSAVAHFPPSVEIGSLGVTSTRQLFSARRQLGRILRTHRADVLQTWLYHGNCLGAALPSTSRPPLVWNLRSSQLERDLKASTRALALAGAPLSRLADGIVCASAQAQQAHADIGYQTSHMTVIENGVDVDSFRPDRDQGRTLRHALGIADDQLVIGRSGRFDDVKGYDILVDAFIDCAIQSRCPMTLLLWGPDVHDDVPIFARARDRLPTSATIRCLGSRRDNVALYNASDIYVSSSRSSEGFPNALAEAVACGCYCIATDVGASRQILSSLTPVIQAGSVDALIAPLSQAIAMSAEERQAEAERCRRALVETYPFSKAVDRYQSLYDSVVGAPKR